MKKTFKFLSVFLCAFLVSITNVNAASTSSKCDINISKNGSYSPVASTYSRYKSVSQMGHETENVIEPENGKCKSGYSLVMVGTKQMCQKDGTGSASGGSFKIIEVKGPQYKTDKGPAYCIQPGKSFTDGCYCEVSSFNLSECKDKPNKSSDYRCGLAYILINNKEGDYGTVLTALRLWAAYRSTLGGMSGFGAEDVTVDNSYLATTNFYSITAKAIVTSGYTGAACEEKVANEGLLCSGATNYQQSISMFNAALGANGPDIESGGEPKLETKVINKNTSEVKYSNIYVQEKLTGKVKIILKYNGKEVHSDDAICEKGECKIILSPEKIKELCEKTTTVKNKKWTVQIKMENYNAEGLIKEYDHCTNPGKNQKMMVINTKSNSNSSTGEKDYESPDSDIIIACEPEVCDETDKCPNTEMVVHNNLLKSCSGYDTYNEADLKDPYMNCILNACDEETKAIYDQSEKFGVNTETCRVYCREESHYYLANKTKVYAGMQFLYKIEERGVEVKANTEKQHLTSVVLQKLQCTSEIYYDRAPENGRSWLDRYDETVKNMVKSWNEYIKWKALSDGGHQIITKTAPKYSDNNPDHSCSCSCQLVGYYKQNIWYWPSEFGSVRYNVTNISSLTQSGKLAGLFNDPESKESYHESSGIPPTGDVCYRVVTEHNPAARCTCSDCLRANCNTRQYGNNGVPGSDIVTSRLKESYNEYILQKNEATRLIKELKNCNLLPDSDAKEAVNNLSNCSIKGNCIELDVKYDDKKYGTKTRLAKTVKPGTVVTYCKNSSNETDSNFNPECYNYDASNPSVTNEPTSIIMNEADHHEMICNEDESVPVDKVTCDGKKIKLPTNDNVTFTSTRETDFYQNNDYATRVYSGVVERAKSDGTSLISLDKNVYPVSLDEKSGGKTGLYNINYIFTNIWMTPHSNAEEYCHTCSYEVFNNTTLYDCTDDESCNACSMKENKSIIESKNIDGWNQVASKKGYGYVFRPIDLADIFPDEERNRGSNWTSEGALNLIDSIESSANDIYGNDSKLQYSYTLSPKSIDNIRKHNLSQSDSSAGGYTNSSLGECMVIDNSFYNCKSSFLDKESLEEMGVIVNKTQ